MTIRFRPTIPALCVFVLVLMFASALVWGDETQNVLKFTAPDKQLIVVSQKYAPKDYHIYFDLSRPGNPTTVTLHLAATDTRAEAEVILTSSTVTLQIGLYDTEIEAGSEIYIADIREDEAENEK